MTPRSIRFASQSVRPRARVLTLVVASALVALCGCSDSSDSSSNPNAPFLHASTPPSGPSVGSTPVSLIGVGFSAIDAGTPTVTFGGVPATGVSILFDTTVTCTPPAGTPGSVVDIVLTNGNGTTTLPGAFRYHVPPTTSGVGPVSGTSLGGATVTVNGTGFEVDFPGPNLVTFGGLPATNVTVVDDTTLTCETPAGTPGGIVDVVVTNVNGTTTLPSAFRNHLVPTATGVSPSSSTFMGGPTITVTGTGFQADNPGTNTVMVGGVPATGVTVVDDNTLTCTVPAGTPSAIVDIEVSNTNGAAPLTSSFSYHPLPTVAGVAPPSGNAAGSENVTVTGTGFQNFSPGTVSVLFAGTPATSVVVTSDTTLTCDTPAGVLGSVADVQVTTNNGSSTLSAGYSYTTAPSVTSLTPNRGAQAGGDTLTVSGSGFVDFSPGTNVLTIDGVAATIVSIIDDSTLTCTLPVAISGPGAVDVAITNDNGSFTLTGGFTYNPLPTLSSVSPGAGPGGGAAITLSGTGFQDFAPGTNVVTVGGVAASGVTVISDTTINCVAPPGTPGTDVDVVVTNDNGAGTLTNGFRYALAPTVSSVTTNSGPAGGGNTVTLTGTGFQVDSPGTNIVTFDGVMATGVVVSSDTSLDCVVPAGAAGSSVDVVLSNNNGSDSLLSGYTFHALPTVSALDVTTGPAAGGTAVAITGTGFQNNSPGTNVVTFDGNAATVVSVPSDTTINVTVPAGTAGLAADVVVTNDNGSDTLLAAFTYNPLPTLTSLDVTSGPGSGGTAVTLTGSGFVNNAPGTNVVTFDGNAATVVSIPNDTTLNVTVPAGTPGLAADVVLTNDNGSDTLTGAFTYHPAPVVTSLDVVAGPSAGGTAVAITGSGFVNNSPGTNVVTFDGNAATIVSIPNDTTINVTVPAGTAGLAADVVVTNDNGADTLTGGFSYHPAPSMISLDVTGGPAAGGTAVTVTGSGFTSNNPGTNVVTFDGNAATIVSIPNDTTINVTVPAGTAGLAVDVVVSNDNGSDTLTGGYSYHPLPTVVSLDVSTGPLAGGNPVVITGTGFASNSPGTNVVTFDGNAATVVSVPNDTTINVTAPPGSNGPPVDIVVTNDNGSDTLLAAYTYNTPPTLVSLDVTSGPAAGGTAVALTGTGFVNNSPGTNVVTFDGNAATIVSIPNDTTINVTVPAGTAGLAADVVITNDNGSDSLTGGYTYHPLPAIVSLDVTNGPAGGGTAVTITGSGFVNNSPGTNVVTFDGNAATIVSIPNDTTINVTVPAGTPSTTVDVVVTNDNGAGTLMNAFTYNGGPIITSLNVTGGPAAGGTAVAITGSGFVNGSPGTNVVTFDGNPATIVSIPNDAAINVTVPAGVAGTSVDVVITNNNGSDTLSSGYAYHPLPTVTSLDVTSGPAAGGTAVAITGTGFQNNGAGTNVVTVDGNPATVVSVPNDTTINVTVPAGAAGTTVDVVVTNDNGAAILSNAYSYHPTPTVSSIVPNAGSSLGGTAVTITGTGFQNNSPGVPTVEFGGTTATSIVVVNDTTITCDTPAGTAGASVLFRLANNNGIVTQVGGFTYHPLPTVTSLDVTSGPAAGGTAVAITGTGFQNNSAGTNVVTVDGNPATVVSVPNDTTINITVPAGAAGTTVDVVVTNDNGAATLSSAYSYHPLPTVVSLDITSGPAGGGTAVAITGTGFQNNSAGTNVVTVDGNPATVVSVPNDTTINITVPAGAAGAIVDVVVTNDNGAATLSSAYTYHPLPTVTSLDVSGGPAAGGTAVAITGTGFQNNSPGTNLVTVDGNPATVISVPNDTTINVTVPAGAAGTTVDVVVTNDNGAATLSNAYTYYAAPTIVSLNVTTGPDGGGTAVTITGTGFQDNSPGTNVVTFDGNPATVVSVPNDSTINVTTPAGTPGTIDVVVSNDNGSDTLSNGFIYTGTPDASMSTVTVTPAFGIAATGGPKANMYATVRDALGNPIPGLNVQFSASGQDNTLTPPGTVATDGTGQASGLIDTTTAEIKTITAVVDPGGLAIELDDHPTTEFTWVLGNTYYVRLSGNDTYGGTTPATPWRTLAHAALNVSPGDTVYVGSGTYNETVSMGVNGTALSPVRFIADLCGDYTGDPAGPILVNAGTASPGILVSGDYTIVEDFTVHNSAGNCVLVNAAGNVTLRGLTLYDGARGIFASGSTSLTVESCIVSNQTSDGVRAFNSPSLTLSNNLIYNNGAAGLYLDSSSSAAVEGTTIYSNATDGIFFFGSGGGTVMNNIVVFNLGDGLVRTGAATMTHDYNLVHGNAMLDFNGTTMSGNEVDADPLFVDPDGADNGLGGAFGDDDQFYLSTGPASPALDMGTADAWTLALSDGTHMADRTSRLDDFLDGKFPDQDTLNVGYHYKAGMGVLPSMAADDARLSYGYWDTGSFIRPKSRTWNGTTWSTAQLGFPVGNQDSLTRCIIHRPSPLDKPEELLAVLSEDPNNFVTDFNVQRWTGTKWELEFASSAIADTEAAYQGFHLAYEQSTGDALVVYSNNTATPVYRAWTQGVWSAETSVPLNDGGGPALDPNTGIVRWVHLEPKPGDDEITLAYVDRNEVLVAMVWDGTQWVAASAVQLDSDVSDNSTTARSENRVFDLAYEGVSGDLLAAWSRDNGTGVRYTVRSSGSMTWPASSTYSAVMSDGDDDAHFVDLASEPGTDRIALAAMDLGDADEEIGLAVWNGTAFQDGGVVDSQPVDANDTLTGRFPCAVGWVGTSGKAVCVYADDTPNQIDSYEWTSGGGWSSIGDVALSGKGHTESVLLATCLTQNELIMVLTGDNHEMFAATYDGSSWTIANGGAAIADVGNGGLGTDALSFSLFVAE